MLAAASATVVDVLLRWLAGRGILALNEVVSMAFGVSIAACIPAGVAGGVNLKIDIFARWITGRLAAWLDVFGAALLLLFFGTLTYRIFIFSGTLYTQGRSTVLLGWPMWPFISVADALFAMEALIQAVIVINKFRRALSYQRSGRDESYLVATVIAVLLGAGVVALAAYALVDFPG